MANKAWKEFERKSAALFGLTRCPANSGEDIDFPEADERAEAPALGQCKEVKAISLNEVTKLAEHIAERATKYPDDYGVADKIGVVCVKIRRGRGQKSAPLVVMTFDQFERLFDLNIHQAIKERRASE